MQTFDTAIIGTGPAGISAALNLKLHNKDIIWFGSEKFSIKVEKSEKIANYPGFGYVSGEELIQKFRSHVDKMGIKITEQMVTAIAPAGKEFMLSAGSDVYMAKTILLATGVASGKGFGSEEEFLGRGVSYCATCDGFLYKGRTIAVFCQDARFEHEVDFLAEIAGTVYLYTSYQGGKYGKGGSETGNTSGNIRILASPIRSLAGEMKVSSIELANGEKVEIDGLFCLRNAFSPTTLIKGINTDGAHIVVNRMMETNIAGIYAAGDCTGRPYQIAKSVGEGNVAAHSILEYLAQ